MKRFSQQVSYLERERNFLPWIIAMEPFRIILDLLEPREAVDGDDHHVDPEYGDDYHVAPEFIKNSTKEEEGDYHKTPGLINEETKAEVRERFKTWVINLMMPYFYVNGFDDDEDATEEEKHLKKEMKYFACRRLQHQPCLRFERKRPQTYPIPLTDEEYCDKMLPKIVHQSNAKIEVALEVLERCADQVMDSPKREEFMAKLTAKVATKEEVKRLAKWEKKHESHCSSKNLPPDAACYEEYGGNRVGQGQGNALEWAKVSIEQAYAKSEAREKCRDMVFNTLKHIFIGPIVSD